MEQEGSLSCSQQPTIGWYNMVNPASEFLKICYQKWDVNVNFITDAKEGNHRRQIYGSRRQYFWTSTINLSFRQFLWNLQAILFQNQWHGCNNSVWTVSWRGLLFVTC